MHTIPGNKLPQVKHKTHKFCVSQPNRFFRFIASGFKYGKKLYILIGFCINFTVITQPGGIVNLNYCPIEQKSVYNGWKV
jgi:hypothetical protein